MPVQELPPLFVGLTDQSGSQQSELVVESAEEQELVDFVSLVLADTEETWHTLFPQQGDTYQESRAWSCSTARSTRPAVWGRRP